MQEQADADPAPRLAQRLLACVIAALALAGAGAVAQEGTMKSAPLLRTATLATPAAATATGLVSSYKLTPLPMDSLRYHVTCVPKIQGTRRFPQTTGKCRPEFFPYVADPESRDALMKLVGNHDYEKGGSEYASGFSPPFRQKAPATFLVFPPMKQVTLVRVDDFEIVRDESRDIMAGVYLSIVGGKVVDQIGGCDFGADYICRDRDRAAAKLTESGKFQLL